jgi:tetratricopeptide (TPR) repeat protein
MEKKTIILILLLGFIFSCQLMDVNLKKHKNFSNEYQEIFEKFKNDHYFIEEGSDINDGLRLELEGLLEKYNELKGHEPSEIIRIQILIVLSKFDEAETRINEMIKKKSRFRKQAELLKVQLMVFKGDLVQAFTLLKECEDKLDAGEDLFTIYLYFSMYSENLNSAEEYCKKFLNTTNLPESLIVYKPLVYRRLSCIAVEKKDLSKAVGFLEKAISIAKSPDLISVLQSQLRQLSLYGTSLESFSVDQWINSAGVSIDSLKGKVVILHLFAVWSAPSRYMAEVMNQMYSKYKSRGLEVLGLTKLYGVHTDQNEKKKRISKIEEISLVTQFIKKINALFPIGISYEGEDFEKYQVSVIPTLVFIDKKGTINCIESGTISSQMIHAKIKKLLEEK